MHFNPKQQKSLEKFEKLLIEHSSRYNLISMSQIEHLRQRHICDSLKIFDLLNSLKNFDTSKPLKVIDIGSGAGLPALPMAIANKYWHVTSVEATGKKIDFQNTCANELELGNFTAVNTRIEEIAHKSEYREKFDILTARAVANLSIVCELGLPLVKTGGILVAWKGPGWKKELDEAKNTLEILNAELKTIYDYHLAQRKFTLLAIVKIKPAPQQYPREWKKIKASPL